MPLPLYGSGGRSARIFTAVSPSASRFALRSVSPMVGRVSSVRGTLSTSAVTPSGRLNTMGWLKPSAKWICLPFTSARKPTPRMSSLRSQPLATPLAALARRLRARPWSARASRVSSGRLTWICPSFTSAVIRAGKETFILPLGPSKATAPLATEALTFGSSLIASFPIRLMSVHRADQLAADVLLAGLDIAEDALAGGEDADAQAAEDRADLSDRHVAAQAGLADPLDPGDDGALVRAVLQLQGDLPLRLGLVLGVVRDVALLLEDAGDLDLHLRGGDDHLVVARPRGVADAGQHVANRIVHWHVLTSSRSSFVRLPSVSGALPG